MYDERGNYPWHQYETITPGIFMPIEMQFDSAILILESALALSKMRMPPTVRNTNHCYANEANSQFGSLMTSKLRIAQFD